MSGDEKKIVEFPKPDPLEERACRLQVAVDRLAAQSEVEQELWLDRTAEEHGIEPNRLRALVNATIKTNKTRQHEQKVEQERREHRAEKQQNTVKREQERKQKEVDKKAEHQQREKKKALATIVKLPSAEHEGRLKLLARQLGEDVEVLREEFAELRGEEEEKIKCSEVEPWDEPVDTRELLDEVATQFGRYIIVHDRIIAPIVPLWICFAWCHDIAAFSPILVFESADSGEAKTAASKVVASLTPRAYIIVEPTGPAFYRFVDRVRPTLIIDDADRLLPRRPDLAHIINASWTRGVPIPRVDKNGNVHLFDPFCPKVLNGINLLAHLAPATRTRCITVKLLPKLENEEVADHRHADRDENFIIARRKLLRWSIDHMAVLDNAKPEMPEGFFNRLRENYYLLFAIADLAGGGDWSKRARAAASKLAHEHNTPSLGKRLLAIFFDLAIKHQTTLFTSAQLEQLVPAEDDAFANYKNDRPINKYQIAALLKPYCDIQPKLIHPRGGKTADRGYDTTWPEFTLAFKHYLGKALPRGRSVFRNKKPPEVDQTTERPHGDET
jgi:putative DNA primase/helicase